MASPEYQLLIVALLVAGAAVAAGAALLGALRVFRRPAAVPAPREAPAEPEAAARPAAPPARPGPPPAPRPSLRAGLANTRNKLVGRLGALLAGKRELDPATLDELERLLFGADLGVKTADHLLEAARAAGDPQAVRAALRDRALELLRAVESPDPPLAHPHVTLVVGVNGSGKTTSIGKLALRHRREGRKVVLGAADTFRAAAIDQLAIWAERTGVEIVRGQPGGDPAAVAFDAVAAARARDLDVVLLDTAGRLQTDAALMAELEKISRVIKKELPDAPHEVVLVLDANTGQNAIRQALAFLRAVKVDRILLAKLDGTARGGVVLGIAQELGLPVRWVGLGESAEDLVDFDAEDFVDALFADEGSPAA